MFESPIDTYVHSISKQIEQNAQDDIYSAVVKIGINIDKYRLLKMLYDSRSQYDKGYVDGLMDSLNKSGQWIERGFLHECSNCHMSSKHRTNYCSSCGAPMKNAMCGESIMQVQQRTSMR